MAGVVAVSMNARAGRLALELAREDLRVWPALGLHPWEVRAEDWEAEVDFVAQNLSRVRALGEVGLDYKKKVPKDLQRRALAAQLELAAQQGRPALLHCRFSEARALTMLDLAGVRGVFHWFNGDLDILARLLDSGHFISITPSAASSPAHRAAVAACPFGRLLLETDSPVPHLGLPSEPARMVETCRVVAEIKGIPHEEVAVRTTANAKVFFS